MKDLSEKKKTKNFERTITVEEEAKCALNLKFSLFFRMMGDLENWKVKRWGRRGNWAFWGK